MSDKVGHKRIIYKIEFDFVGPEVVGGHPALSRDVEMALMLLKRDLEDTFYSVPHNTTIECKMALIEDQYEESVSH